MLFLHDSRPAVMHEATGCSRGEGGVPSTGEGGWIDNAYSNKSVVCQSVKDPSTLDGPHEQSRAISSRQIEGNSESSLAP